MSQPKKIGYIFKKVVCDTFQQNIQVIFVLPEEILNIFLSKKFYIFSSRILKTYYLCICNIFQKNIFSKNSEI